MPGLTVAPYVPRECGAHPGVEPDASDAEVRKAYRQAAKRNHPDKGGDAETFKKINEAWQVRARARARVRVRVRVWARVRRGVAGSGSGSGSGSGRGRSL